jgi:hypothetical protein
MDFIEKTTRKAEFEDQWTDRDVEEEGEPIKF